MNWFEHITLCKILLCHHSWWEAAPREALCTNRDLSDGSSCDICFHKLSWALILHTEPAQGRWDATIQVCGWLAGQSPVLFHQAAEQMEWASGSGHALSRGPPPHTHTPWTFVSVVKGGWYAKRSPRSRMLLFPEVQMTHFLVTQRGSAECEASALSERLPPAWAPSPSCQHFILGFNSLISHEQIKTAGDLIGNRWEGNRQLLSTALFRCCKRA